MRKGMAVAEVYTEIVMDNVYLFLNSSLFF